MTAKTAKNIWNNPSPYGTYTGEKGNPKQWRESFNFAWNNNEWTKSTATKILDKDSPYAILGVSVGASEDEIKKAFRILILKNHPDKGGNKIKAQKIIAAYVFLTEN